MKIQTKLSGFFIILLAVFSYLLLWTGTRAYRQEVASLNAEVCREKIKLLMNTLSEQDNLFFEKIYKSPKEAQEKVIEQVKSNYQTSADFAKFPFIVSADSRYIVHPTLPAGALFTWDKVAVEKLLKTGEGEIRLNEPYGEKIVFYQAFKPWRWLVCYSLPADVDYYAGVSASSLRQIIAVLGCMLASVALLYWLIQKALAPLSKLADSAENMAAGKFPEHDRRKYPDDEVGIMGRAFDDMAAKIQNSMADLQAEIGERRNKEMEFRELIENSPLPMAVINPDKTYSVNNMFSRMFGYSEKDMTTFDDWFNLAMPDESYRKKVISLWVGHVTGDRFGGETFKVTCKNGETLEIEVRHKLIGNRNLLIFNDLTDRKRVERELRTTRNYLNQVLDSIKLLLAAVNENGIVTQWNRPMEQYTGIKAAFAIGSKLWDVAPFLNNYRTQIEEAAKSGKFLELYRESIIQEHELYFNISINPLPASENPGAVIILEDVTELIKKGEQLVQAQKMETVGTLAGGLAHDFNNVLGGIKGAISMVNYYLKNSPSAIGEIKEFTAIAERSTTRASSMVEQLLTLSRKSQLTFNPVDLKQALLNVLEICRSTFDKSVTINTFMPASSAMVKADQTQIEQVMLNLLINAEHAMTLMLGEEDVRGGTIDISIKRVSRRPAKLPEENAEENVQTDDAEPYWEIAFKDTGIGIPREIQPKIFDPFFTTKSKGRGTGLGLAMVYSIMDRHNGYVEVQSEPGEGSTFTIGLPELKQDDEILIQEKTHGELAFGTGLILIIDDEEAIRITASKMLEAAGYDTICAVDGTAGCELYKSRQQEIKAVLLDMAMPGISGLETYQKLKEINPAVKALMTSGYINDARVQRALAIGADGFIKKPFSLTRLSEKMGEVLSGRQGDTEVEIS
ncbi:MAG: ATP-binding protein [Victivallaceae bacterium]|jgi:PAS domain S-box-containing protein